MDSGACGAHMWGFPKIRGAFFGVPMMRTKAFLKPMLGSSHLGKLPCVLVKVGVPAGVKECRVLASPEYCTFEAFPSSAGPQQVSSSNGALKVPSSPQVMRRYVLVHASAQLSCFPGC